MSCFQWQFFVDAADGRHEADVDEWLFSEILQDVRFRPDDQRLSSIRSDIRRSVAGMLW